MRALSLGQLVQARGMSWFHLPIADDEAPDAAFEQAWPGCNPDCSPCCARDGTFHSLPRRKRAYRAGGRPAADDQGLPQQGGHDPHPGQTARAFHPGLPPSLARYPWAAAGRSGLMGSIPLGCW